jgi:DNA-binding transcriptional LysR family regulator
MSEPSQWAGLELRHLLALRAIVEQGSFHKAAAHLDYSQSGISQQIAALERIVGERLIDRPGGSRPVQLTEVGHVVLDHARMLLDQVNAAQAEIAALRAGSGGLLRVGAFQSAGAKVVPPLMSRLSRDRPCLRLELTQTTSDDDLFALMEAGRLDITFAILPVPRGPFVAVELFTDPFVVMVGSHSALAQRGGQVSLGDLVGQRLIIGHARSDIASPEAHMRQRGLEPDIVFRCNDSRTVQGLVAAGAGIACVPRLMAESADGYVRILELSGQLPPLRIGLSWRADRPVSASREAFVIAAAETCSALALDVETYGRRLPGAAMHRRDRPSPQCVPNAR